MTAERPYDHTLKPDPINYYDIAELVAAPDAEVAVADLDGRLIGSGYATKKRSRTYVDPEYHAFIGSFMSILIIAGGALISESWITYSPGRGRMICPRSTLRSIPKMLPPFARMRKLVSDRISQKCA